MAAGVVPRSCPSTSTRAPAGVERTSNRPGPFVAPVLDFPPLLSAPFGGSFGEAGSRTPVAGAAPAGAGVGSGFTGLSVYSRPLGTALGAAAATGAGAG